MGTSLLNRLFMTPIASDVVHVSSGPLPLNEADMASAESWRTSYMSTILKRTTPGHIHTAVVLFLKKPSIVDACCVQPRPVNSMARFSKGPRGGLLFILTNCVQLICMC